MTSIRYKNSEQSKLNQLNNMLYFNSHFLILAITILQDEKIINRKVYIYDKMH